jgi:hypothetical protein
MRISLLLAIGLMTGAAARSEIVTAGMFYVAPKVSTRPLEQLFRVRVIQMLVKEELLAPEMARKLLGWKHSGFKRRGERRGVRP